MSRKDRASEIGVTRSAPAAFIVTRFLDSRPRDSDTTVDNGALLGSTCKECPRRNARTWVSSRRAHSSSTKAPR